MATEQLAVKQKQVGDGNTILVSTVDELRDHLGALRVKAFLWSVTMSTNKDPDLIIPLVTRPLYFNTVLFPRQ